MKRISLATLATIGLTILACGGGEEEAAGDGATASGSTTTTEPAEATNVAPAAVPMTDPWKGMDLPVNNGTVVVSDSTHLLVTYNEGAISTYTTSYGQQIEKLGWSKKDDYSEADFTAVLYTKGSQEMGFAVGHYEGMTIVYFEDLDGVPEEQRVVKRGGKQNLHKAGERTKYNTRGKAGKSGSSSKSSGKSGGKSGKSKGKSKGKGKKGG